MKAYDTLTTYGLDAFGVDVGEANSALATFAQHHKKGPSHGARAVQYALESLLQKCEAVDDGRSLGFRISDDEAACLDVLIRAGTHFSVRRDATTVRPA